MSFESEIEPRTFRDGDFGIDFFVVCKRRIGVRVKSMLDDGIGLGRVESDPVSADTNHFKGMSKLFVSDCRELNTGRPSRETLSPSYFQGLGNELLVRCRLRGERQPESVCSDESKWLANALRSEMKLGRDSTYVHRLLPGACEVLLYPM